MRDRFGAFVTGITACYKYIQRIKSMEMTEFGLKGTHVMCLFFLDSHPEGLTAARLCQLCGEDKAAISRALAELERRDYLHAQQVSGKKYRVPLLLTPEGKEIARQMNGQIDQWVSIGGDGLSQQERADFYRCLELIAHTLKEQVEGN